MLKEKLEDNDIPKAVIDMLNEKLPDGLVYKKEKILSKEHDDSIYMVSPENNEMTISINESGFKSYEDFIENLKENNEIILESKTLKINNEDFGINDIIKNPITNEEIFGDGHFIFAKINEFNYTIPFKNQKNIIEINGELTKIGEQIVTFKGCDNEKKIFVNYEINDGKVKFNISLGKLKTIDDLIYVKEFYESSLFDSCKKLKVMGEFYSKLIILIRYLNIESIYLEGGVSNEDFKNIMILYNTLIDHEKIQGCLPEDIIVEESNISDTDVENIIRVSRFECDILGNKVVLYLMLNLKENNLKIDNRVLNVKGKKLDFNIQVK